MFNLVLEKTDEPEIKLPTSAGSSKKQESSRKTYAAAAAAKLLQLCLTPCDPIEAAHHSPLSLKFPRQEHWGGLPFPSPGDLSDPGIEPGSPTL